MKIFLFNVLTLPIVAIAGLTGFICFSLFGLMMWLENKIMKTNNMRENLFKLLVEFSSKVMLHKAIGTPLKNDTSRD